MEQNNAKKREKIKRVFSKNKRIAGIILSALSALLAVFMLVLSFLPKSEEGEVVHATFSFGADTQILATLNANSLYDEDTLTDETVIPYQLTRDIEAVVTAQFSSDVPLELQGDYVIDITLGGVIASGEVFLPIYTIHIPMAKGTFMQDESNPNVWTVNRTIPLDMASYSRQITSAAELIGISPELNCKITFSGSYTAETPNANMVETFTHSTILPVSEELVLLEFKPDAPLEVAGQIATVEEIVTPAAGFGFVTALYIIWILLSGLAFFFFFFETRNCNEAELFLELKNKVLRKYGSRMISVASFPSFSKADCITVHNIENLLLISEDLRRPVFYCKDEKEIIRENIFYLQEDSTFYILKLEKPLLEEGLPSKTKAPL